MKHLLVISIALLGMAPAAFADLTAVLSPNVEVFPPGADPGICNTFGVAPCVQFSGTLTDTDTDGSFISLNGISITYGQPGDANYLTLDNTFSSGGPPLIFVGDPTSVFLPFTYTGVIFGVDILPTTPIGIYTETAVIQASGGTNDPNGNGFNVDMDFTIDVNSPEPSTALLMLAGLVAIVAWRRRTRVC
jgi:hypothetical protein